MSISNDLTHHLLLEPSPSNLFTITVADLSHFNPRLPVGLKYIVGLIAADIHKIKTSYAD
jgi:hypothetical protein